MAKPERDSQEERRAFLSAAPAGPRDRRLALWTLGVSSLTFLAAIPFAKVQLAPYPAFIAAYQSALAVSDLVTAALLFAQFKLLGSRALLALASAYLFTAFMAVAHALTFPGLLAPTGLLGAGPQSTAWMYMFWHAGFPALAVVYAFASAPGAAEKRSTGAALAASIAAVALATVGFTLLATTGASLLPPIMQDNRYTPAMILVVGGVWALSALALLVLWRKRPQTVLDLWLMVVICAWLFDIGLAAVFNGGRYDLGFYAGRVYGLAAACFVLVVLLVENAMLYRRLLNAHDGLAAANKELDAFSYSVSHDLRAPLRAMDGYAAMLEEDAGARLGEDGRQLVGKLRAAATNMRQLIEGLLELSRLGRREPERQRVGMTLLAREIAAELGRSSPAAKVSVAELPDALADPVLIRQVWANLIGNAFKYSSNKPQPKVEIGARSEGGEIVYWVRDNGAGFDMQHAERLFGVFQRLHSPKEFPGTGVGLALVQRIVQRHGGRVWAEARPGEGATFHFSLRG